MTTHQSNLPTRQFHPLSLRTHMIIGAAIGLILMAVFLFLAGEGKPEWPAYWRARPLVVETFAGAMGGLCWYLMDPLRYRGAWQKVLANFISAIIFIFGLWIGSVLGLVGTLWD